MDIRKIDLNLLVVLDALLRLQNVSRAAEALGMSQPALSYALKRLRPLFDDPLFVRSARGMQPTPRAQQLAEPLRAVLDTIQSDVLQQPRFDPATTERSVTFNMSDVGELVFLPRLLAHLKIATPGIDVRTVSTPPSLLEDALRSGAVDLAVGYFPGLHGAGIYQQRLFSHSFVCLVRKDHPSIGRQISKKQFLDAQHAVVYPEGKSHELFEQALIEQGLTRRVVLSVPHYLAIPMLVAELDLIVTVPYAVGTSFLKMANIKMLAPPIHVRPADVRQIWHARFHQDQLNKWMRGVVVQLFGGTAQRRGLGGTPPLATSRTKRVTA